MSGDPCVVRRITVCLFALTCFGGMIAAQAQVWPAKPIRVVYPYAAGGVGDTSFRAISILIEPKIGQRFVIEARPGAAGNIGAAEVARAAPDGYTLLIAPTASYSVNQHLFKKLTFDPLKDFEPIAMYADSPLVVVMNAKVPANTLKEFIDHVRANPGKLNFGSPGSGSPSHLTGELIAQLTGGALTYIPYGGTPPMVQAMLAGDIHVYVATLGFNLPHVKAGRMRLLAVTAKQRMDDIPDVPTTPEAGYPDLLASNWWALVGPRGVDSRIVERLAAEVRIALTDAGAQKSIRKLGMLGVTSTPAELARFMRAESDRWKVVIERGGIKVE